MFTTQNTISSQDEKCRTSVNKAKYLSLYPWVKMKVWCESRNTLMKTCTTIWYMFGPCQKCSDKNQVCDMQTATKFIPCTHPHYTKQYCDTECHNFQAPTITSSLFVNTASWHWRGAYLMTQWFKNKCKMHIYVFSMQDTHKPHMCLAYHISIIRKENISHISYIKNRTHQQKKDDKENTVTIL
jgi:hypothetical protein